MASPQKENGYVAVANDIYDALAKIRIPGEARQLLDVIIRQTYGYNKKEDSIALSQFVDKTGIPKPECCRALAKLQTMNIIVCKKANDLKSVTKYGLNKNYDNWKPLAKKQMTIGKKANAEIKKPLSHIEVPLAKKPHTKDINTKDNITKDRGDKSPSLTPIFTPSQSNINFFKGIKDLIEKVNSTEAIQNKVFFEAIHSNYPLLPKEVLWREIKKFYSYWTEPTPSGKKQLWQKRETFDIPRRLTTWFSRVIEFEEKEKSKIKSNRGKNIAY